jgi:hypothetical protein
MRFTPLFLFKIYILCLNLLFSNQVDTIIMIFFQNRLKKVKFEH